MSGIGVEKDNDISAADGVTTVFTYTFFAYEAGHVKVYSVLDDVLTPITTGITITPNSNFIGGTVTFSVAPASSVGDILRRREVPYTQTTEFTDLIRYKETAIEKAFNTVVMQVQQIRAKVERAMKYTEAAGVTDTTIETPVDGKALIFDGTGGRLIPGPDAADIAGAQGYAAEAMSSKNAAESARDAAISAAAGIKWRPSVKATTTAALPSCSYSNGSGGVGATLTATANGALAAQDGVTLIAGDRLLVKDQAAQLQNGVYTVAQVGTGGTPFILTRATDADTWLELVAQAVIIEEGTTLADQAYICTVNQGGTLGTTSVTWATFNPPLADGSVSYAKCDAGVKASLDKADTSVQTANGQILQVLSTTKTDTFSHSTSAFTDVTGLSQAITPGDNTNKVLVMATVSVGADTSVDNACFIKLLRDGTEIGSGASDGANRVECMASATPFNTNAIQTVTLSFLDSPASASSVTYKVQIAASNSGDVYVNRSHNDTNATSIARCSSTITVMEVRA